MAGPIDTRLNPTKVNELATSKPIEWFERNLIATVPAPHAGAGRRVYPGFVQLGAFMSMNLSRHVKAHLDLYAALVQGKDQEAHATKTFYDEYFAVLDKFVDVGGTIDLLTRTIATPSIITDLITLAGANVPIAQANGGESLLALVNGKFVDLHVPYPMGFFTKNADGRIDDPGAGWKGRGLWTTSGTRTIFHNEGGTQNRHKVYKLQMRPDPLAH